MNFLIALLSSIILFSAAYAEDLIQVKVEVIDTSNGTYKTRLITDEKDIKMILFIISSNIKNKIYPDDYGNVMHSVGIIVSNGNIEKRFYLSNTVDSKGTRSGVPEEEIEKIREMFSKNTK